MSTVAATAAPRQRKPRPARSVRLVVRPTPETAGVVRITNGKVSHDYLVTEFAADFGRAFNLEKVDFLEPASSVVNLDGPNRTCDCPGGSSGHGRCKHADGLAALVAAGRL